MERTISLIIPIYNEDERVCTLLQRLTLLPFHEIIIVDGGSKDKSIVLAQKSKVTVLHSSKGRGIQMNNGASVASGEILLFLHADVQLPENALELIEQAMQPEDTVAGAFRTKTVANGRKSWVNRFLWLADLRSRYHSLPYGDQAIFVRRKVFEQLQGFPEIPIMEDLAFSQKLYKIGQINILKECVMVSGRRFQNRPFYYTFLVNIFPLLYHIGVKPESLAKWYPSHRPNKSV